MSLCRGCRQEVSEHDTLSGYCMLCADQIIKKYETDPKPIKWIGNSVVFWEKERKQKISKQMTVKAGIIAIKENLCRSELLTVKLKTIIDDTFPFGTEIMYERCEHPQCGIVVDSSDKRLKVKNKSTDKVYWISISDMLKYYNDYL